MRYYFLFLFLLILFSCGREKEIDYKHTLEWTSRQCDASQVEGLQKGKTYLPVYSHIYHRYDHHTFDLTITVSIRNVSLTDTVYIFSADYFDTYGKNIRQYLKHTVYLKPMETIEIIIEEEDQEGGSGANFIFDWAVKNPQNPPLFEAVMISTSGQQGLSFSTRGVNIYND